MKTFTSATKFYKYDFPKMGKKFGSEVKIFRILICSQLLWMSFLILWSSFKRSDLLHSLLVSTYRHCFWDILETFLHFWWKHVEVHILRWQFSLVWVNLLVLGLVSLKMKRINLTLQPLKLILFLSIICTGCLNLGPGEERRYCKAEYSAFYKNVLASNKQSTGEDDRMT